jgi:hypothetical protein
MSGCRNSTRIMILNVIVRELVFHSSNSIYTVPTFSEAQGLKKAKKCSYQDICMLFEFALAATGCASSQLCFFQQQNGPKSAYTRTEACHCVIVYNRSANILGSKTSYFVGKYLFVIFSEVWTLTRVFDTANRKTRQTTNTIFPHLSQHL